MISLTDIYHVVAAMVPLYVAMILAYVSMRYCKLFTPDQCAGINKFVAKFSIPLLSFQVISSTNPYKLNVRLLLADFLQKVLALAVLFGLMKFRGRGGLKWIITGVSLATLPNTLIIGIPLLKAMYGGEAAGLVSQVVVLQSVIWYNALLFLFEFNAAKVETNTESPELLASGETEMQPKEEEEELEKDRNRRKSVLMNVGKKLVWNPNTHATMLGVIWACVHHRWSIELPPIISNSISILSEGGLGMAMFSLGLFMASRASLIACGTRKAIMALALKFLAGPALMAVASVAVRLKGSSFKVAIVQAALPQGIVPFVFAKEYNVHPDVLSTGVIFGMLVTLPISLVYYLLLSL